MSSAILEAIRQGRDFCWHGSPSAFLLAQVRRFQKTRK